MSAETRKRLRTDASKLPCPEGKPHVYYTDIETPRLRLKVSATGRHVWDWRSRNETRKIGVFDPKGLAGKTYQEAKAEAERYNASVNRNENVHAMAVTPGLVGTLAEMTEFYLQKRIVDRTQRRRKKSTEAGIRSCFKPLLAEYGHMAVADVNQHVLLAVVEKHGLLGRVAGQKLIKSYRAAWNFCKLEGVLPKSDRSGHPLTNPASNLIASERELTVKSRGTYAISLPDPQIVALLQGIEAGKANWQRGRRARPGSDETPKRFAMGYCLIEFMLYTGCRPGEAQALHITDIKGNIAQIDEHKTDYRGEKREIFLSANTHRVLAQAAEYRRQIRYTGPLVFPSELGNMICNANEFLENACVLGGVGRRLIPHNLRSVYINFCVRAGVPLTVVSRNVGHSDIRTTQQHYEAVEREIREQHASDASAALDRLARLPEVTTP